MSTDIIDPGCATCQLYSATPTSPSTPFDSSYLSELCGSKSQFSVPSPHLPSSVQGSSLSAHALSPVEAMPISPPESTRRYSSLLRCVRTNISPSAVPARANIAALKSPGVKGVLALSAVGSLREDIRPGEFVVPDRITNRTQGVRPASFFEGTAVVAHAMFGGPFDTQITNALVPLVDIVRLLSPTRNTIHHPSLTQPIPPVPLHF
ncbi:hypothetical protein BDV93DRAFT_563332 [Ceratobasidium sp. AG-I]|nr:hypothetical protein BDV93DRAFT_563332 [Ceratobasidium sp. AG-I]